MRQETPPAASLLYALLRALQDRGFGPLSYERELLVAALRIIEGDAGSARQAPQRSEVPASVRREGGRMIDYHFTAVGERSGCLISQRPGTVEILLAGIDGEPPRSVELTLAQAAELVEILQRAAALARQPREEV